MRTIALGLGILVAAIALWFLGREERSVERASAALPARAAPSAPPRAVEPEVPDEPEAREAPVLARRSGFEEAEIWVELPTTDSDAAPAPRGCVVRGRVVDARARTGLAGVDLSLEVRSRGAALPLLSAETGADGEFELVLPRQGARDWSRRLEQLVAERRFALAESLVLSGGQAAESIPDAERREALRAAARRGGHETRVLLRELGYAGDDESEGAMAFALRVTTAGYVPRTLDLELDPNADITRELEILLQAGETLRGRVLGILGEGIGGVEVHLVRVDDLERAESTVTDPAGEYLLPMPVAGLYHLHARADGHGAVVVQSLSLPPIGDAVLPDILLRGDGRLGGYVRDPDGNSVEGLQIIAVPAEFEGLTPRAIPRDRLVYEEMQGGLYGSTESTTRSGWFDFTHMAEGTYVVRFADDPRSSTGPPVNTPTSDLNLVYPRHRLRVEVRDSRRGDVFLGGEVSCKERRDPLPDGQYTYAEVAPQSAGPATALHFFVVDPGSVYEVSVTSGGQRLDEEVVTVVQGDYQIWIYLRADPPAPSQVETVAGAGRDASGSPSRSRSVDRAIPGLVLLLTWGAGAPPDEPLPTVEASVARLEPDASPEPRDLSWLPLGKPGPGALSACTSPLPPGRYRLRLRSDGVVFQDVEAHVGPDGGAVVELEVPAKDRAPFAR